MSYSLHALIGPEGSIQSFVVGLRKARIIRLKHGLFMVPVTDELFKDIHPEFSAGGKELFEHFEKLSATVAKRVAAASKNGAVAYVEAEYFGGAGGQDAVVWRDGETILGPLHEAKAINQALRLLGVAASADLDEFDTVGLGHFRKTEQWGVPSFYVRNARWAVEAALRRLETAEQKGAQHLATNKDAVDALQQLRWACRDLLRAVDELKVLEDMVREKTESDDSGTR